MRICIADENGEALLMLNAPLWCDRRYLDILNRGVRFGAFTAAPTSRRPSTTVRKSREQMSRPTPKSGGLANALWILAKPTPRVSIEPSASAVRYRPQPAMKAIAPDRRHSLCEWPQVHVCLAAWSCRMSRSNSDEEYNCAVAEFLMCKNSQYINFFRHVNPSDFSSGA